MNEFDLLLPFTMNINQSNEIANNNDATTNNVQNIPEGLKRPGRFDMTIELGYCSKQMFLDICRAFYEDIEDLSEKHIEKLQELLLLNIAPVYLINALIQTDNFEALLQFLLMKK
jgi:SpoVK/Ycf46/Vps4 family AAA+-type ATPase